MRGQLWQECDRRGCREEPVCCECQYCERHCQCGSPQPIMALGSIAEPYRRGLGQGFGATEDGEDE